MGTSQDCNGTKKLSNFQVHSKTGKYSVRKLSRVLSPPSPATPIQTRYPETDWWMHVALHLFGCSKTNSGLLDSPRHSTCPSPSKPCLHLQTYSAGRLQHSALSTHLPASSGMVHSSISAIKGDQINIYQYQAIQRSVWHDSDNIIDR